MKALVFGATGMVGRGVLLECLRDPEIDLAQTVGRSATGIEHAKLRELVLPDLMNYDLLESQLSDFDACFFCLGVSSGGLIEAEYTRITYGITLAAANVLVRLNPKMAFVYVSGAGTDATERGRSMWARVKGKTENALLQLPFRSAYMFRPAVIQPLDGVRSKTPAYQLFYGLTKPFLPLLRALAPSYFTTTRELGRAMIAVAKRGAPNKIIESADIRDLA